LMENLSFWGSGRPRAAQKPFKKVGGSAPHFFKGFLGRPGPPRAPKRTIFHQIPKPPSAEPPSGNRRSAVPARFLLLGAAIEGLSASYANSHRRVVRRPGYLKAVWRELCSSRSGLRSLRGRFFMDIDVRGGPRRSRGVPGVAFGRKSKENRAENLQPDGLQVPLCGNCRLWPSLAGQPSRTAASQRGCRCCPQPAPSPCWRKSFWVKPLRFKQ